MSYAIVESGGKQYVAREGQALEVDRLPVEVGKPVEFDRILLVVDGSDVRIGTPAVLGIKVHATVAEHTKGDKIIVYRYIPKERYRKKRGHRQQYTRVMVDGIGEPSGSPKPPAAPKKAAARTRGAAPAAKKAEARKAEARKAEAPKAKPKSAPKKK
jgi:large subunit ribosomal protein L21